MASQAEAAVNRAIKALLRRDDDLARRTKDDDCIIDQLEMEIDEAAIKLLAQAPALLDLRLITMAMKISHDLERVGDEATTISRRCLDLSHDPPLKYQNQQCLRREDNRHQGAVQSFRHHNERQCHHE